MATIDPAVQWLFWLLLCPLAYVLSWAPQWIKGVAAAAYSASAGLTCAIDVRGAGQYPAACVLQLVWCAWLWFVVLFNAAVGAARLFGYTATAAAGASQQGFKGQHALLHTRLFGSISGFVEAGGANPPLVAPRQGTLSPGTEYTF